MKPNIEQKKEKEKKKNGRNVIRGGRRSDRVQKK